MKTVKFKLCRYGAFWIDSEYHPYSAEFDDITETYYFQNILTGEVFDIVEVISDDEIIVG